MNHAEKSSKELLELLNDINEQDWLEAKSLRDDTSRPILETVCSFCRNCYTSGRNEYSSGRNDHASGRNEYSSSCNDDTSTRRHAGCVAKKIAALKRRVPGKVMSHHPRRAYVALDRRERGC